MADLTSITALSPWPDRLTADNNLSADWIAAINALSVAIDAGATAHTQSVSNAEARAIEQVDRLGASAAGQIESYGPGAPTAIKNECVIRLAGWIRDSAVTDRVNSIGPINLEALPHNAGAMAFRNCGAQKLLAPYRQRGAGVAG